MPLFDHFRGPLARRAWQSLHSQWAGAIAADLNRRLPKRFVAESPMSLGSSVSADVAEYEELTGNETKNGSDANGIGANGGGVALATETYAPPTTFLIMPIRFDTEIKVEVRDTTDDYRILAVMELVSPGDKQEKGERERFAAKCLSYLGKGIGLVAIDIVTNRLWNLHNGIIQLTEKEPQFEMPHDPPIYVAAYRPVHRNKEDRIDLWHWPLEIGGALPAVPLALKGYGCVRLDFEATYAEACERSRIP